MVMKPFQILSGIFFLSKRGLKKIGFGKAVFLIIFSPVIVTFLASAMPVIALSAGSSYISSYLKYRKEIKKLLSSSPENREFFIEEIENIKIEMNKNRKDFIYAVILFAFFAGIYVIFALIFYR